jgi:hypothetical protein
MPPTAPAHQPTRIAFKSERKARFWTQLDETSAMAASRASSEVIHGQQYIL